MSRSQARPARWRATAWTVIASMLLPSLLACTTAPPEPTAPAAPRAASGVARLDGIVVDGTRAVQGRESGLVTIERDGATIAVRDVWTENQDHAAWLVATKAGLPVERVTVWAGRES